LVSWQNCTSLAAAEANYHPHASTSTETLTGQHEGDGGDTRNYTTGRGKFRIVSDRQRWRDFFTEGLPWSLYKIPVKKVSLTVIGLNRFSNFF